jgi:hypothetical protein
MARTPLTVVQASRDGVDSPTPADGDTTNGHVVRNTGRTMITVANADAGSPHTVTFVIPGTVDGQAVADRTVSIPPSASQEFGQFPTDVYGGQMAIDVDSSELKLSAREP